LESLKDQLQLLSIRLRQHDAALRGLAQGNLPHPAKLLHPLDVAEKIHRVRFISRKSREDRRPNFRRILSANGFAVLGSISSSPTAFTSPPRSTAQHPGKRAAIAEHRFPAR